MPKEYLGDSVYVDVSDGMLVLTTENGMPDDPNNPTNRIILERKVVIGLIYFAIRNGFRN